ncbi:MAG: class I SAM-dependent methyltransferase [Actinomycetota bacterium]|nr:class I SAM-dependent methyltransferase [Actinomycetota bacterium]
MTPIDLQEANELRRRAWSKEAPDYDKRIGFLERRFLGQEHRRWACGRARGDVLEVAIGTGLNLAHYPEDARLVGLDLVPEMLALARRRAEELGRSVDLREGDAHDLPFADASFDSVVCTYSLCNIPDERRAIAEMKRVLRPGGELLLVDHVRSTAAPLRWAQRAIEAASIRFEGEHMTRRPFPHVVAAGFDVVERDRFRAGIVERIAAVKPKH